MSSCHVSSFWLTEKFAAISGLPAAIYEKRYSGPTANFPIRLLVLSGRYGVLPREGPHLLTASIVTFGSLSLILAAYKIIHIFISNIQVAVIRWALVALRYLLWFLSPAFPLSAPPSGSASRLRRQFKSPEVSYTMSHNMSNIVVPPAQTINQILQPFPADHADCIYCF